MPKNIPVEEKVERSNTVEGFRQLADAIPTLCWMADAGGEIYWYNKRWYEYTGITPGQTQGRDWELAHDPKDHSHIIDEWKKATQTGEAFDMVVSLKGADGKFRPFLSHIVPSKDDEGRVTGWLGIKNDITDLRAADKALRASEGRFKTLAEAMPQMAFAADREGSVTYYNKRWYDYVGGMEGTEGWGWKDKPVHHPKDLERVIVTWNESVRTGKDYEIEYRLRRHDGQYRWHLGRAVAVRDEAGSVVEWIGTNTDVHEQKRQFQTQDFLLEVAKELSKTLDYKKTLDTVARLCVPAMADWCSIDLLNNDGVLEQVTVAHIDPAKVKAANEFRARSPMFANSDLSVASKVAKTGKGELYPYVDYDLLEASLGDSDALEFLKDLKICSVIVVPLSIRGEPGGAITLVASESGDNYSKRDFAVAEELASRVSLAVTNAMLFHEAQAELARSQHLEQELTEEKAMLKSRVKSRTKQLERTNEGLQAEVELRRETEAELQRSNQELQDFAYVASHDLQEPLRKIQAFGDILESEYGERLGDGAEYLTRMHGAATRMSQLIEDLLTFSRVTTSQPAPSEIDLNEVVEDVISDLENRISRTSGRVEVGDLPIVMADSTHMRQLFQNLIANALKFNRDDVPPVVKVTSSVLDEAGGMNEILIEDNGIGFDEKYAERIFGVFQRLHGRGSYEGTGIGLAVCRKIVEQYGGTIVAEGQPGKGSKFIIKFPVVAKEITDND